MAWEIGNVLRHVADKQHRIFLVSYRKLLCAVQSREHSTSRQGIRRRDASEVEAGIPQNAKFGLEYIEAKPDLNGLKLILCGAIPLPSTLVAQGRENALLW